MVGLGQQAQEVQAAPAPDDLGLHPLQSRGLGLGLEPGDRDPRIAAPRPDAHPAGLTPCHGGVQVVQCVGHAPTQVGDEGGSVEGLVQGGVMVLPVDLEVLGQVGLGVPPPVCPHHPHLPPS